MDELSGKSREEGQVNTARMDDLGEVARHNVYTKVFVSECWEITGQAPIGPRWVDVNIGGENNPDYKQRLAAQEVNDSKSEDLFAATPP